MNFISNTAKYGGAVGVQNSNITFEILYLQSLSITQLIREVERYIFKITSL